MVTSPSQELARQNTLVLANAIALGSSIMREMSSNLVAGAINGNRVTRDVIETALLNEIVAR